MTKSIRGTFTRPSTDSVWAMYVFFPTVAENVAFFETMNIITYMKGNPDSDLTLIVDHVFPDETNFDLNKATVYSRIPAWTNDADRAAAEEYTSDNGQTLVLEEVTDPNLTGYIKISDVPRPEGL